MFLISQLIKFLKSYRETLNQIKKIRSTRNEKPIDIQIFVMGYDKTY